MTKKILSFTSLILFIIFLLTAVPAQVSARLPVEDRPPAVTQERNIAPDDQLINDQAQIQIQQVTEEVTEQTQQVREQAQQIREQTQQVQEQAKEQTNQVREQSQEIREQAQQQSEQARERAQQIRAHVTEIHAARLETRFEFYYQRLTKIADKLEARLQTLAQQGVDITEAQEKLATALLLLEEAMERSNNAINEFRNVDPDQYQTQRQFALQARDEALQARQLFMQAMQELREAVLAAMQQAE